MRWLRRVHLYSGLALLPWVLIYGVSGFLFNHGGSSAAAQQLQVPAEQAPLLAPDDEELSGQLLSAMDESPSDHRADLSGSWTFEFTAPDDDKRYRLSMPIDGSSASLSERRARSSRTTSFPSDTFADARARATRAARATLDQGGVLHAALRATGGPSLRVTSGDRRWFTTLTRDRVSESPVAAFDLNRMVRRLHVTHGYSRPDWPRVIWAVFVDLMAFAMVMWAITGVAMWWQKKSLRVAGGAVIAAAFGGGLVLVLCLQAQFNS